MYSTSSAVASGDRYVCAVQCFLSRLCSVWVLLLVPANCCGVWANYPRSKVFLTRHTVAEMVECVHVRAILMCGRADGTFCYAGSHRYAPRIGNCRDCLLKCLIGSSLRVTVFHGFHLDKVSFLLLWISLLPSMTVTSGEAFRIGVRWMAKLVFDFLLEPAFISN